MNTLTQISESVNRTVTIISDGDLYRWQLQRSPVNRTVSTTPFTTFERALEAAQAVANAYDAELVEVKRLSGGSEAYAPFSQPDEFYADVQPAEYRDDYVGF